MIHQIVEVWIIEKFNQKYIFENQIKMVTYSYYNDVFYIFPSLIRFESSNFDCRWNKIRLLVIFPDVKQYQILVIARILMSEYILGQRGSGCETKKHRLPRLNFWQFTKTHHSNLNNNPIEPHENDSRKKESRCRIFEILLGPGYMRWDNPGVNAIRKILQNFS